MKILANHQLGNAVAELPTQMDQPEETKTDKSTESLVDNKLTESLVSKSADWKKSDWQDWGNSYWMPQSRGSDSWSSQSWQEKDNSDDKSKNNFYKKQKTSDSPERSPMEEETSRLLHHALPWNFHGHLVLPRRLLLHPQGQLRKP